MDRNFYNHKPDFYPKRSRLLKERISILRDRVGDNSLDRLTLNTYSVEILDIEYELEILKEIEQKEESITKECQENFKHLYKILMTISQASLKQYSNQIQETYSRILPMMDKEWPQGEKNILYTSLKDLLKKMRLIQ